MRGELPRETLARISSLVGSTIGLHFPPERWGDLSRGLAALAAQEGFGSAGEYAQWLLSATLSREQVGAVARQLTVGETYFFREAAGLDALERGVLPDLIRTRRAAGKRLRIWSAGCCTGEEPYTIAMLLDGMVPDLPEWNLTILATDINSRSLEVAQAGEYGAWSFRSAPPTIKERYFTAAARGRFKLARRIRRMVTFSMLNLAEDAYPSLVSNTNAMDVIFCRNVLMYFTPQQAARAVSNLREALVDDGWLLVAPCETSQALFGSFAAVTFPEAILYRKSPSPPAAAPGQQEPMTWQIPSPEPGPLSLPAERLSRGGPAPSAGIPTTGHPVTDARTLANRGELVRALALCDQAIASDGVDPGSRFLRAMIAQELGMLDEARKSLEQALYLDPDFVMAHVVLGSLAGRLGRSRQSRRHLRAALGLLSALPPECLLPEGSGLTAGRMIETIRSTGDWRDEA